MKKLSVIEFQRVCQQIAPATFIFDTENQSGNANVKMVSRYSDVVFMLNPNRICLKNECGTLCFDRVNVVRYFDDKPTVGAIFDIVCGDSDDSSSHTSYTIVVDSKKNCCKL